MEQAGALQASDKGLQREEALFYTIPVFADNHNAPVFHGFFGRRGGVSTGVYNAMNCRRGSDDARENVEENWARVGRATGLAPSRLLSLHQIHSKVCVDVEDVWSPDKRPEADAMVTDRPGIALGVLTADCAPVLFWGMRPAGPVIGAAHAGWKGAIGGVLEATVAAMERYGADRKTIRAGIGPCISQSSYEVSDGFLEPFMKESPENERFFKSSRREGHFMFDLAGYCAFQLSRSGLKHIAIKDVDTYFNEEDLFSYRRATHRGEKDYGGQVSLIYIKE